MSRRDQKFDAVELAILHVIQDDEGCFANHHADELIAQLTATVVDDPRSDWHDEPTLADEVLAKLGDAPLDAKFDVETVLATIEGLGYEIKKVRP